MPRMQFLHADTDNSIQTAAMQTDWSLHWVQMSESNTCFDTDLGPVVQSIVSLTSALVVKMLTALLSTISNPQVFLLKMQKLLTFFQQKY